MSATPTGLTIQPRDVGLLPTAGQSAITTSELLRHFLDNYPLLPPRAPVKRSMNNVIQAVHLGHPGPCHSDDKRREAQGARHQVGVAEELEACCNFVQRGRGLTVIRGPTRRTAIHAVHLGGPAKASSKGRTMSGIPAIEPARTAEGSRLAEARDSAIPWKLWGPYLSERQWGTVREDYSENGDAWNYFNHDHARSRAPITGVKMGSPASAMNCSVCAAPWHCGMAATRS